MALLLLCVLVKVKQMVKTGAKSYKEHVFNPHVSLVPRLSVGGGKREPGIHCLRMRLISQKSWEIGNYRVISVKL